MEVTVKITGGPQILRRLQALPKAIGATRGGPLRKALRAGGKVIKDQAIENAPQSDEGTDGFPPGRIKRALRVITERHPERFNATEAVRVDVRKGRRGRQRNNTAYHARFVEFGTEKTNPQPFLRPAWDAKKGAALHAILKTMEKVVSKAERKLARMK